jgi:ATP-dependent helicase HrpB
VVEVPGRLHPIEIHYRPKETVASAAVEALAASSGDVLCFLPGSAEIRRAITDLHPRIDPGRVDVVPLYGALDAGDQDRALAPSPLHRRIVVATNIAETSITVPGVTAVVDAGLHKVARYDAGRGIDSLETERIPADAADQRAGRAGRLAPGIVWRLWEARDRLRPHREPEIQRVDLCGIVLAIIAWGGDPRTLEWFERPRDTAIDAACSLLERLGALDRGRLTPIGEQIHRVPLHPRLARMIVAAGGSRPIARACALVSERHFIAARTASTSSDLLSALDAWPQLPPHVQAAAREIEELARQAGDAPARRPSGSTDEEDAFRRALLVAYPDRVAQRRVPGEPRVLLSSGAGGVLAPESGVRDGEFLVAIDVQSASGDVWQRGPRGAVTAPNDARVRVASRVERDWLRPTHVEVVHRFDAASGIVRAERVEFYDALTLAAHPARPDPERAAALLAEAWHERGPGPGNEQLLRRLRFAGRTVAIDELVLTAARDARSLADLDLQRALPFDITRSLDRDAPETLAVPSGRSVRLEYGDDGSVMASVKLQELFGLADSPVIGRARVPVTFSLLSPAGRPVQVTRDLRSFWERTYPEVRKELRGRYPKHPWPEDPWTATPTHRTKRKT